MSLEVVVNACASFDDCDEVAALCGSSFPEEVWSQGLSVHQWAQIEADDLRHTPAWWKQIGLAREGSSTGRLLGVVVLTLEKEADESISWSEYSRRVGCGPTVLSWMYDQVLDEALLDYECLIDFIAVSPEARGKGVGAKLMCWAEDAGTAILAETQGAAVAALGVDMTLWVAADNAAACRLYQRSGYAVVRRTDSGTCTCLASQVHKWFLGHPVWIKMRKQLPVPEHLASLKPCQQSFSLAVAAGSGACAALACTTAALGGEGRFEEVPLGPAQISLEPAHDSAQTAISRSAVSLPAMAASSLFGSKHPVKDTRAQLSVELQAVGSLGAGHLKTALAGGSREPACGEALASSRLSAAAAAPACARSVASASVALVTATSDSSDSEDEEGLEVDVAHAAAAHRSTTEAAGGCDVFRLVSLKSDAETASN
ncbi:hypothetical protein D9Q98_007403 [Chlorella vulgaris]|uniref:N-acetyltransferase domain-containing protein n=1 Tax=Chlorella vulgaris TaxID=3077 RepID=A0A9D4TL60_CHLVU|nr:hypothetical protein D9Q98_007403 [Chlorella vulgaris]